MSFRNVIPRTGLIVRYPDTKAVLPESGASVPWIGPEGRYWRRRLACGDIAIAEQKQSQPQVKKGVTDGNII